MYIAPNGQPVDPNAWVFLNDVNYPPGWFTDPAHVSASALELLFDTTPPAINSAQKRTLTGYGRDPQQRWVAVWLVEDLTASEVAAASANFTNSVNAAVNKCYSDVDAVYRDAIGDRGPEYIDAETDARAFKAANYVGTPTSFVSGYAAHNPTGTVQTNQWAADAIIARADAFTSAKLAMRNQRFASQAAMRASTTQAQLTTALSAWNSFITNLRGQLGL